MLSHSPTDPLCCPSQEITQHYKVNPQANSLITLDLSEKERNPNEPKVEIAPVSEPGGDDNVPIQPPDGQFRIRF